MRATAAWQPQVPRPSHLFLATASKPVPFQGTLTQQPSSLELELPQKGWLALGLEVGLCSGASSLLCQEPFSETVALLRHGLGPLKGHGALLPDGGLAHLLHEYEGAVSTSYSSFSCVCPVCSLSWNSAGSLGKVVSSGFDRRKTNKYCINMKKTQSPR